MHELVGKAREEDEQFWQQLGFFQEADSDDDYIESSCDEDIVDSDFDQPEEEEAADGEAEAEVENGGDDADRREARSKGVPSSRVEAGRTHRLLKDPPVVVEDEDSPERRAMTAETAVPPAKKVKRLAAEVPVPLEQRSVAVREKTLEKTKEAQRRFAEWEKRQIEKEQKRLDEPKPEEQVGLTQAEQMQHAAFTEQANQQSLQLLQQIEMTKQKHTYAKKDNPTTLFVHSTQRIVSGVPTTVFRIPLSENLMPLASTDTSKRMGWLRVRRPHQQKVVGMRDLGQKGQVPRPHDQDDLRHQRRLQDIKRKVLPVRGGEDRTADPSPQRAPVPQKGQAQTPPRPETRFRPRAPQPTHQTQPPNLNPNPHPPFPAFAASPQSPSSSSSSSSSSFSFSSSAARRLRLAFSPPPRASLGPYPYPYP